MTTKQLYAQATQILLDCEHPEAISSVRMADGSSRQVCCDCWNLSVHTRRAARKAQLAQMPRCEFCKRRATQIVGAHSYALPKAQLCGHHFQKAQAEVSKRICGMFWLSWDITGEDVREILRSA